jgi:hypothetical protein
VANEAGGPEALRAQLGLAQEGTVADLATVQIEGERSVTSQVAYYNLDVIISVGCRVKSLRGTQFRRWALAVLKEYLVTGFAMNDAPLKEVGGGSYWRELLAAAQARASWPEQAASATRMPPSMRWPSTTHTFSASRTSRRLPNWTTWRRSRPLNGRSRKRRRNGGERRRP